VTENPPLELIGPVDAFVVEPETMLIASRPLRFANDVPFAFAPLNVAVPKSASGSTPPLLDGASAITSAEPSFALLSLADVVWLQPRVVLRRVSVKFPRPSVVTDAVKLSPGLTASG